MKIKLLVMDVDGTLTDGKIYMGENGEVMKAFNVKDGYAIAHMLPEMGIVPVIITGRKSMIVENRAKELSITELYQGVGDKLAQLKRVAEKYNTAPEEIAYIGDDLNDLECIEYCGVTACPADAVEEVKRKVKFVCKKNGGEGTVREFIDIFKQMINRCNCSVII
ncbi:KdsC family phosphatase [Ruminococcus sp. JL13D9]|uniref:KdsC family phosphatase n=1 Tax=Ruminococcus sp. JL13D9 TaxID=3233381 RepID=UPI003899AEB1